MIVNNGIISYGDHNKNTVNINEESKLVAELNILLDYSYEKQLINDCIKAIEVKNKNRLIEGLKKFSKKTFTLIESLALNTLQKYIDLYILNK